jgi:hypothetical protein
MSGTKGVTGYRALSEADITEINDIKKMATEIGHAIDQLASNPDYDQRCVALAKTNFQQAFMWAVRAVAKPTSFG